MKNTQVVRTLYSITLIILLFSSCKKENEGDCFISTGEIIKKEVSTGEFSEIDVYDNINLLITQDTFNNVVIEAGENLIPFIITQVEDGRLTIRNNNRCDLVRSYKKKEVNVFATTNGIKRIIHNGYGWIKNTDTLINDAIDISVNSYGDVELTVKVNYSHIDTHSGGDIILKGTSLLNGFWTSGNNWVRCSELITDTTYLDASITGNCYVNATKKLDVKIHSSGDVYYSGNP
ncbi:MAG: DUF2807 domain-containing protein, partial [Bacteroidota bacterium]